MTATSYSNGGPPSGCFYSNNAYVPYLGNLVINGDDRMMGSCSTTNRCICRKAPVMDGWSCEKLSGLELIPVLTWYQGGNEVRSSTCRINDDDPAKCAETFMVRRDGTYSPCLYSEAARCPTARPDGQEGGCC